MLPAYFTRIPPHHQLSSICWKTIADTKVANGWVDPRQPPAIDSACLKHPADVAVLGAGVKVLKKMSSSQHLKNELAERKVPLSEVDLSDTQQASDAVNDWVLGEYHPAGSCAMGVVVASRLKSRFSSGGCQYPPEPGQWQFCQLSICCCRESCRHLQGRLPEDIFKVDYEQT